MCCKNLKINPFKKMSILVFNTVTTGLPLRNDKRTLSDPKDFKKYNKARLMK